MHLDARSKPCDPTEIPLKSFFLGPQSENAQWLLDSVRDLLESWFAWRQTSFPQDGIAISRTDQQSPEFVSRQAETHALLAELSQRFEKELPKYSPRYVGHMFSEISLPALLGHILTLLHNPNIIARESATVAADIENEAIQSLATMVGLTSAQGHFTSGGTVANYEAVVRASARVYAWLAAGAVVRERGESDLTAFQAAHQGWQAYQKMRDTIDLSETHRFLPESVGSWQAGRALEQAYSTPFRGPVLIVPRSAHYSWKKAARIFGLGEANVRQVDCDEDSRYRIDDLRKLILRCQADEQPILAVVSVTGTTETGAVDPVDQIDALLSQFRREQGLYIWHHVDAAYGGFFCAMLRESPGSAQREVANVLSGPVRAALEAVPRAQSITLDPHKLGYVPYSSGAFLTRDARDYRCVRVLAPYLDYDDPLENPRGSQAGTDHTDKGPYTLEGSRSAAGAVATWLTARAIGLDQAGYGTLLARTIRQKRRVEDWLTQHLTSTRIYPGCDTNLLCFCIADPGEDTSATNARTRRILSRLATESRYYLTKTEFPIDHNVSDATRAFLSQWSAEIDSAQVLVLRMCLMNPFFDSAELDIEHIRHLVVSISEVSD